MLPKQMINIFLSDGYGMQYKKGEYVYLEGEKADKMYYIKSGKIKILRTTVEGDDIIFEILKNTDILSELVLFSQLPNVTYTSSQVVEDVELLVMQKSHIENVIQNKVEIAYEYINWLSYKQQKFQLKFRDLIMYGKKGALYSMLIRLSNTYGKVEQNGILIQFQFTDQTLAEFCGATRETINRILNDLKKNKVISTQNGFIKIHDISYLKKEINCDNCNVELCQF